MLILLDIDGVMVPANSWRKPEILEDGFPGFSSKAVQALDRIVSVTSADIVLTTSHKYNYSLQQWKDIFNRRGISLNSIDRLPENTNHLTRKDEILNWFNTNKINKDFLIVDDDKSLNGLPDFLKSKLIQTSASVGLTDYLINEFIENKHHFNPSKNSKALISAKE